MSKKYIIKSPDGFTIEPKPYYTSKRQAMDAFQAFKERFVGQGYYSQVCYNGYRRQIPLQDLENYCDFIVA